MKIRDPNQIVIPNSLLKSMFLKRIAIAKLGIVETIEVITM